MNRDEKIAKAQEAGLKASRRVQKEFAERKERASGQDIRDSACQADRSHDRAYNAIMKETAKALSDFKPGDLVVLTTLMRAGEEKRAARITSVDYLDRGYVLYEGWSRIEGVQPTGQGSFYPDLIGGSIYGLQKVEVVGHYVEAPYRGPTPGDHAYDLLC
mgnify:CR=1 FL=1